MEDLPVIDVAPLVAAVASHEVTSDEATVATEIDRACRDRGFFLVTGHGIAPTVFDDLDSAARAFFALDDAEKAEIAMATGGRAWRGWFPLGGELTSGHPDHKEGLYLGVDLPADDPRVVAGLPLHGPNRYPGRPASLRPAIEAWLAATTALGHALVRGLGLALGLGPTWFDDHLTTDPTVLARIFRYPADRDPDRAWGVAEHTDYGLVTILAHDGRPGLEVRTGRDWLRVPHVPGALVVNLGDMVEAMTGGRYRSTPHRVTRPSHDGRDRLSFPVFFDPAWSAHIAPLPLDHLRVPTPEQGRRWDGTPVEGWEGVYGDYLTAKVARVFPSLFDAVVDGPDE